MKVSVNPPKTPVTTGSKGVAAATVPNICKMPGPPAPFVPTPLPNIGKSGDSPKGYSKQVTFEGEKVAIKGATFKSTGDLASKATGGGLVSANTHGPTRFVGPGSLDVQIEGKNVQLLGDPMLNNCGASGSPPNSATLVGVLQETGLAALFGDEDCPLCGKNHGPQSKLEEDEDTKGACDQLAEAADAAVKRAAAQREARIAQALASAQVPRQAKNQPKAAAISAMLGVVKCKTCKHIHAGFSMKQYKDVQDEMPKGWHSPATDNTILDGGARNTIPTLSDFLPHVGEKAKFTTAWNNCAVQRERYNDPDDDLDESFFPPGQCAAQQMMLLAICHGCRPIGLTERWYKSGAPQARFGGDVYIRELNADGSLGKPRKVEKGEFGGKDAIPPCGTCQVILTALMCPDDRGPQCDYRSPEPKVCKCT